jgi:hypothetical protein
MNEQRHLLPNDPQTYSVLATDKENRELFRITPDGKLILGKWIKPRFIARMFQEFCNNVFRDMVVENEKLTKKVEKLEEEQKTLKKILQKKNKIKWIQR